MGNTDLWDRLGKTDPNHTKPFSRAGGFKGTAIKPMFSFLRMTEEFGPCGIGWGVNKPEFQVVPASSEEVLVFCTVSIWHGSRENIVYGVGGDKPVGKNKNGAFMDDEAFKKAFTDAITNALKLIGVGADVHMGRFDDSKYVASLRENPHETRAADLHDGELDGDIPPPRATENPRLNKYDKSIQKVKDARPAYAELIKEMMRYQSADELQEWAAARKDDIHALPGEWPQTFRAEYTKHKNALNGRDA